MWRRLAGSVLLFRRFAGLVGVGVVCGVSMFRGPGGEASAGGVAGGSGDHGVRRRQRMMWVLVHDPELVVAAAGLGMTNLVWDVHEDPAAALQVKSWMPRLLRRPVAAGWRWAERLVERRHHWCWPSMPIRHGSGGGIRWWRTRWLCCRW